MFNYLLEDGESKGVLFLTVVPICLDVPMSSRGKRRPVWVVFAGVHEDIVHNGRCLRLELKSICEACSKPPTRRYFKLARQNQEIPIADICRHTRQPKFQTLETI
jgi:hypothetical protein